MDDNKRALPLRECSKCGASAIPEGGIEIGATRWYCAKCWLLKLKGR